MGPFGQRETPEIEKLQIKLYQARGNRDQIARRAKGSERYWEAEAAVLTLQDTLKALREKETIRA